MNLPLAFSVSTLYGSFCSDNLVQSIADCLLQHSLFASLIQCFCPWGLWGFNLRTSFKTFNYIDLPARLELVVIFVSMTMCLKTLKLCHREHRAQKSKTGACKSLALHWRLEKCRLLESFQSSIYWLMPINSASKACERERERLRPIQCSTTEAWSERRNQVHSYITLARPCCHLVTT